MIAKILLLSTKIGIFPATTEALLCYCNEERGNEKERKRTPHYPQTSVNTSSSSDVEEKTTMTTELHSLVRMASKSSSPRLPAGRVVGQLIRFEFILFFHKLYLKLTLNLVLVTDLYNHDAWRRPNNSSANSSQQQWLAVAAETACWQKIVKKCKERKQTKQK